MSCFLVSVSLPAQSVTRLTCEMKNVDFLQIARSAWNILFLVYILYQRMLRRIGIYDRRLASNGRYQLSRMGVRRKKINITIPIHPPLTNALQESPNY